jgi:hypothetical protein
VNLWLGFTEHSVTAVQKGAQGGCTLTELPDIRVLSFEINLQLTRVLQINAAI